MSRNRSRIKTKRKFSEVFAIIILAIISLFYLVEGVQDLDTVIRWDSADIPEYTGSYSFSVKKPYRNTTYVFELANGDTIYAPSEYLNPESNIEAFDKLTFRYASHKKISLLGLHYSCVSIESMDGEHITIANERIKNEFILGVIASFVLGVLSATLLLMVSLKPDIVIGIVRRIRKLHRRKNVE